MRGWKTLLLNLGAALSVVLLEILRYLADVDWSGHPHISVPCVPLQCILGAAQDTRHIVRRAPQDRHECSVVEVRLVGFARCPQ